MEHKKDKRTKNLTLRDIHVGDWVQVWSEKTERYSPPMKIISIHDDGIIYLVTSDEERCTPFEENIKNVDALEDDYYYDPRDCFEEGAKWADEHPKSPWISVDDDLPCNHKELIISDKSSENLTVTEYVVAAIYGYKILSRMYELDGKWCWGNDEPTHWFPIPKLPKE